MSTAILTGYLSTVNGVAEEHFIIELDSDNRGIDHPAAVDKKQNTFMFKSGLNSYIGQLSPASIEKYFGLLSSSSSNENSSSAVGVRFNGNFFHDEYGGIEGDIPRGSFWFRLSKLPSKFSSRDVKWVTFDGTATSAASVGKPLKLLIAFTEDDKCEDEEERRKSRKIITHHTGTSFNAETNDFTLIEATTEEDPTTTASDSSSSSITLITKYTGKWAKTQQNEKFCGSFVTTKMTRNSKLVESGCFFTIASTVDLE